MRLAFEIIGVRRRPSRAPPRGLRHRRSIQRSAALVVVEITPGFRKIHSAVPLITPRKVWGLPGSVLDAEMRVDDGAERVGCARAPGSGPWRPARSRQAPRNPPLRARLRRGRNPERATRSPSKRRLRRRWPKRISPPLAWITRKGRIDQALAQAFLWISGCSPAPPRPKVSAKIMPSSRAEA